MQSRHNSWQIFPHLGYDVFRILLAVQLQLEADVAERNARVRERNHADTGFYDVVTETFEKEFGIVSRKNKGLTKRVLGLPYRRISL